MKLTLFQKKSILLAFALLLIVIIVFNFGVSPSQKKEMLRWFSTLSEYWWRIVGGVLLIPAFIFWKKFFQKR